MYILDSHINTILNGCKFYDLYAFFNSVVILNFFHVWIWQVIVKPITLKILTNPEFVNFISLINLSECASFKTRNLHTWIQVAADFITEGSLE